MNRISARWRRCGFWFGDCSAGPWRTVRISSRNLWVSAADTQCCRESRNLTNIQVSSRSLETTVRTDQSRDLFSYGPNTLPGCIDVRPAACLFSDQANQAQPLRCDLDLRSTHGLLLRNPGTVVEF